MKIGQVTFKSLIKQINDQFGDISEIYVANLPTVSNVSQFHITVHTGEAESFEQYIEVASADKVTIDIDVAEPLSAPFDVMATVDGPGHVQGAEGTTVYMDDNVIGAKPRELDTGLSILQQKLAGICPICDDETETIRQHYKESRPCRKAERV